MKTVRFPRSYGLFHKVGRRWVRLFPNQAYYKPTAVRVFQSLLLDLTFSGKHPMLRVIK